MTIKYLLLYITLNSIGIYIASKLWWTDHLNLLTLGKESLFLVMSAGLCWIGILYLSILIIRKFIVEIPGHEFIGPIDLSANGMYQKEIGLKNAITFKKSLTLIAFSTLALTMIGFKVSMNIYRFYELAKNGKIETIEVKEIRNGPKLTPYIYILSTMMEKMKRTYGTKRILALVTK